MKRKPEAVRGVGRSPLRGSHLRPLTCGCCRNVVQLNEKGSPVWPCRCRLYEDDARCHLCRRCPECCVCAEKVHTPKSGRPTSRAADLRREQKRED